MPALDEVFAAKNAALAEKNLLRSLHDTGRDGFTVRRGGRELISFCCNDYLGLSRHPAVIAAAADSLHRHGAGAGASRLVTGNHPLYAELEALLAGMKGTEAACVFGSGYLANTGTIPALVGNGDLVIADKLVHACIYDGIKLSGADCKRFSHNALDNLLKILEDRNKYNNCLIVTETVFSMDGDRAPVQDLLEIARKYDAWLMTDDAHGFGVIEPEARAHIQMGTLSKAAGSYGGYVCASRPVIEYIKSAARTLMFSTALPPSAVAASIAALKIMRDDRKLCAEPLRKAWLFTALLGLKEAQSPIVPLILGDPAAAIEASNRLEDKGFLVTAIRPPTVPPGTSRLRFTFSALHQDEDIERLAGAVNLW